MTMSPRICRSTVPATIKAASRRFGGGQFPYLVIWLLLVFGWSDVDAMTMLPRVCRSTVPATMSISARGPVLATITFVLGGLCMELTLYKLASFAAAANWLLIVLGGISMELALNVFTLFPTVRSLWVDMEPGATRFGKTSR